MYRINRWDDMFESAKSRGFKHRTQVYLPNKHGLGYLRMINATGGEAAFGCWVALCQVLSRMEAPRHGYVTDNCRSGGSPLDAADIAALTSFSKATAENMLNLCSSESVGWLSVATPKALTRT